MNQSLWFCGPTPLATILTLGNNLRFHHWLITKKLVQNTIKLLQMVITTTHLILQWIYTSIKVDDLKWLIYSNNFYFYYLR